MNKRCTYILHALQNADAPLTGGIHLHRIGCRDEETFRRIKKRLIELGIARAEG